ncbi:MAG TPA: methyltransferase domain-containing protein [Candidatus Eisenbacteria bacterium]|jgi:phospholipid N-methyltransferase|nr:methyltransferase domain-containing protein [Candidatus Eisenbacteria bacterium]
MNIISFLKVAARDLRVGAVMPSSRWAVNKIMARVPDRLKSVLEYGPGDGVLTHRLLDRLDSQGRLLAIESNPTFAAQLAKIEDPRFALVHGDATVAADYAREHGLAAFDLVISGIPFSMLSDKTRKDVVQMTWNLLRPGGVFLVYQTSPLMLPYLKKKFAVRTALELRNVPPYFIMQATKAS